MIIKKETDDSSLSVTLFFFLNRSTLDVLLIEGRKNLLCIQRCLVSRKKNQCHLQRQVKINVNVNQNFKHGSSRDLHELSEKEHPDHRVEDPNHEHGGPYTRSKRAVKGSLTNNVIHVQHHHSTICDHQSTSHSTSIVSISFSSLIQDSVNVDNVSNVKVNGWNGQSQDGRCSGSLRHVYG